MNASAKTRTVRITECQYASLAGCRDVLREDVFINKLDDKAKTASLTYTKNSGGRNAGNKSSADMLKTDKMDANNTDTYVVPLKGGINSFNITSISGTEVMHYFKERNAFIEINNETYKLDMGSKEASEFMDQFISKVERVVEWQLGEFQKKDRDAKFTTISIYPVPSHSSFNKTMANTLAGMSVSGMAVQLVDSALLRKDTSDLQRDEDFIEKNKEYYSQLSSKDMPERGTHGQNVGNAVNKMKAAQNARKEIENADLIARKIVDSYQNITNNILPRRGRRPADAFRELRNLYDQYVASRMKARQAAKWFDNVSGKERGRRVSGLTSSYQLCNNIGNETLTSNVLSLLSRFGFGVGKQSSPAIEGLKYEDFQIKASTNDVRMGLKNFYRKNDEFEKAQEEIRKANGTLIVIFDDNVSGGATLGDICYQLNALGLYSLVPITFGKMRESWNIGSKIKVDKPSGGWNF